MATTPEVRSRLKDLIKAHGIPARHGATCEEKAVQLLSDDRSGRTNQFEVKAHLEGLVEKCGVLNNDPLADALQARLNELPAVSNKWTPEVLSLLLHLSDRPVHKTQIEDLSSLDPKIPPAPLTWQEIIEEDPLEDQTAIWRNIDFTADGSDEDDDVRSTTSEPFEGDDSFEESLTVDTEVDLDGLIVQIDGKALEEVYNPRDWRAEATEGHDAHSNDSSEDFELPELVAIREVLFMLLGLPTFIFPRDHDGMPRMHRKAVLSRVSGESVASLFLEFIELGQKLHTIRHWIRTKPDVPLEQTFQNALQSRLSLVDSDIHMIQARMLDTTHTRVASLLHLSNEICASSRLIIQLYAILVDLRQRPESQRSFLLLQSLYDQTYTNQNVGDDEGYEYMARIFFECFRTYLKPMRQWMDTGEIGTHDCDMFIKKIDGNVSLHSIWQDQHHLVYGADGALNAPLFLHVAGQKIFNTGKSINFLKQLGYEATAETLKPHSEPPLHYEAIVQVTDLRNLIPFPEIFDAAFARWIASKHHSSSLLLRDELESRCGLRNSLDALEHIFFYRNGALSKNVVIPLFERIELGKQKWNDVFTTTDMFHEAFVPVNCIDLSRLSVYSSASTKTSQCKERSMKVLEDLLVGYTLAWPVANIIRPQSMATYQSVFILLTQIERAKFLLERHKLLRKASNTFYAVHTNLLWFVNTLLSHLTTLVLAVNTARMRHELSNAEDVDAMIAVHQVYMATLEDQCFLAKKHASLRQAVLSILDLAVVFSDLHTVVQAQGAPPAQDAKTSLPASTSSSDDDDEDENRSGSRPVPQLGPPPAERLTQVYDTYSQLLKIVTSAVEGVNKADGGPVWETLAGNLAFGAVR